MFYIFVISMVALLALGIWLMKRTSYDFLGFVIAFGCGSVLFLIVIFGPITYFEYKSEINQYYVTKQDLEDRHETYTELENAALTQKVIELNRRIAEIKYWKENTSNPFIPKEVMELEYLK
jgi:Tfp pilus assembly protein PilN